MAIGLGLLSLSCASKKDNIIAIDVLLTPSEEMNAHAIQLNELIKQNNPETISLDKNHIPHITLLQAYIKKSDLQKVRRLLHGLYDDIKDENLKAKSISYNKEEKESFAMITIEKSEQLLNLHKKTIDLVKPFMVDQGTENSFVQNPDGSAISESTVSYVSEFVEKHSYENFDPHISLGVADTVVLDSLTKNVFKPMSFKAPSISLYKLGDHGTAQKPLWRSE